MKFTIRPLLASLAISLASCTTLGPDYKEPDVAWLKSWEPSGYGEVTNRKARNSVDLSFWWKLFNDPSLNRLIDIAKRENLALRTAGLRVLESRALLGVAGSTLYPQLQQATGAIGYVNNQYQGGNPSPPDQDFGSYQAGFNLAWELDFWGRFRRSIESADAAFFASLANQRDAQLLVSAGVVDLYYAYRLTEARIAIAIKNAKTQKRSFEITTKLFESGEQSELDLQQAKTQYLATLSTIPELELTLTRTRNALAVLLGRPPGVIPELKRGSGHLPIIPAARIDTAPAQLLGRRPDVRAAAWAVAAQSAQIGIAEAEYYPAISLLGSLNFTSTSLSGSPDQTSLVLGPSLRWNIFDHGRIKNNILVQDARLQQLIASYRATVLQAAQEVDDAAVSIRQTAEQIKLTDRTVEASERALEIANRRYQEGFADFQRVLDAQRTLFTQSERQLLARGSNITAVVSLYKSLGGGWIEMPLDQLIPEETKNTMQQRSDWSGILSPASSQ
ncbi:MAG: TolC family protein [Gammaproteobacteria bacterium]|jgi:NodT family efflux transporter outer membrane factor (OMF) lipoprotein